MIIFLSFTVGFSLSLNVALIIFLIFAFRSKKLSNAIYDNIESNVEIIEKSKDPFNF